MAISVRLSILAVVVGVTAVAHAETQCRWMDQPVARDNDLVQQTVRLAVNQLEQQGLFTGLVEAFDEAALYEYEPDWNVTLSVVDAVLEGTPKGVVQCDLSNINPTTLPQIVTAACIGPDTSANWQLHIRTEFAIIVEHCKIVGMATADTIWPYGPYQLRGQPANLTNVRFSEWAIPTATGFPA